MAWDHLSITKPHLVYIILGGFTSLFMLCSSVIKERLYIGEATVATICGIIFGPHAADLINPLSWGNTDEITLEFARIVLVVQCFAVGVELPKAYMERHWRSVVLLLVPVMTFGWLITSLFIWAFFNSSANWLDCLCIAACVTATDPVLASSVVGKGKFAKRVPKHLRDLLSAESGCNDGMAFPFIYLALYIIRYKGHPDEVALNWFCITILYECVFGAIYGVTVGYIARRLIRYAHEKDWIDRESFLVFYFVLALFCAGSGSLLGMDDLLIGFACGVGFSNDGWFTEKTEESHVSNVIDLLLNLTFFVYFGTIIPWRQFNIGYLGLDVWKLVVIAFLVLFFRRIPIMLVLKPVIPDIKTWREALFAGHFGPIGVGAIFVAILARADLETDTTVPTATLPGPDYPHDNIIQLIWPITTFLVLTSIIVHGSSVAVFTLGKHINTLTLTMSYTQANDQGPSWMDRLPRIQSRSKSSMSIARSDSEMEEKPLPPGMLPPIGKPGNFLRRQKEEDNPSRVQSRSSSRHRPRHSKNWDSGLGPGGPVSQSAIAPQRRRPSASPERTFSRSDSETLAIKGDSPQSTEDNQGEDRDQERGTPGEIYEEGGHTVYEDEEGNVLAVERERSKGEEREEHEIKEGRHLMHHEGADQNHGVAPTKDDPDYDAGDNMLEKIKSAEEVAKDKVGGQRSNDSDAKPERPGKRWREGVSKMNTMTRLGGVRSRGEAAPSKPEQPTPPPARKTNGPARAYQYGNTIVIEDEDGEVIKKYDIPGPEKKPHGAGDPNIAKARIGQMGKYFGIGSKNSTIEPGAPGPSSATGGGGSKAPNPNQPNKRKVDEKDDELVRFTLGSSGRRMSKADFIDTIQQMDPKRRAQVVENSNAPEPVKQEARKEVRQQAGLQRRTTGGASSAQASAPFPAVQETASEHESEKDEQQLPEIQQADTQDSNELRLIDTNNQPVPFHDVSAELRNYQLRSSSGAGGGGRGETAAERRRRLALQQSASSGAEDDSEDDGTERVPPQARRGRSSEQAKAVNESDTTGETAAERRRREGALGIRKEEEDSDSDEDDGRPRQVGSSRPNIRFADQDRPSSASGHTRGGGGGSVGGGRQSTLRWGKNVGR